MGFLDNLNQNTLNMIGKLSQMPRASTQANMGAALLGNNENAATKALELAAQEKADERKEQRSALNQIAQAKTLYGLKQEYADEEEKKRLEKLASMNSELQTIRKQTGKEPSLNQKLEIGMKYGLPTDDLKMIAGGGRSGTGGTGSNRPYTYENNGVKETYRDTVDDEGNVVPVKIGSSPTTTEAEHANQREKMQESARKEMMNMAELGGYIKEEEDPLTGAKKYNNLYNWQEEESLKGNDMAKRSKALREKYLGYSGYSNDAGGFNQSSDDMNIKYVMEKHNLNYGAAKDAVNKAKAQGINMPYSYATSGDQTGTGGATETPKTYDQIKASVEGAANPSGRSMVRKAIPGAGQQTEQEASILGNPFSGVTSAAGQMLGDAKNALSSTWDNTVGKMTTDAKNAWNAAKPEQSQTSTTQQSAPSQWVDSVKSSDYWQKNSENKGFGKLAPSYVRNLLANDDTMTKQEKKEAWSQLESEYAKGDAKKIWDKTKKSLGF